MFQLPELLGDPQLLHLQLLLAPVQLVLLPPQAIHTSNLLSLLQLLSTRLLGRLQHNLLPVVLLPWWSNQQFHMVIIWWLVTGTEAGELVR